MATKVKNPKVRINTAKGSALFVSGVNGSKFDDSKIEASVIISGEDTEKLKAQVLALVKAEGGKVGVTPANCKFPIKARVDADGNETGDFQIKAKTAIQYAPKFYDSKNKEMKVDSSFQVPNGSIIRLGISAELMSTAMYTGAVFRLNAVQIIEMKTFDSGFDDEGDGFSADEVDSGFSDESSDNDWA